MYKLGASLFVRNAIKYDYCVTASIISVLGFCDHVLVLDCQSTDGTDVMLKKMFQHHRKVTVCSDAYWHCAPDNTRLSMLANLAKSMLDCEWHFMIQADEVLHEKSYPAICEAMQSGFDSFHCRRLNFYGHPKQHVRFDIPLDQKPCNDHPIRLARSHLNALGDGESIEAVNDTEQFTDQIEIHHFGFVRKPMALLDKTIDAYQWFFAGANIDKRFDRMKADGQYRWRDIMRDDQMQAFTGTYPKCALPWLCERWKI